MDNKLLSNIWHSFKELNLVRGFKIYQENDSIKYIYFIRSGEVEISQLWTKENVNLVKN